VPLYYHYTDKVGYNGIMRNPTSFLDRISSMLSPRQSPTFNPSTGDSGDAHYGDGFYFTDLDPETYSRVQVARALWDGSFKKNFHKTEYFIEVEPRGNTLIEQCRPHVFRIPPDTKARRTIVVRHGKHPGEPAAGSPAPPQ
jgi:hypothetical protein